MQQFERLAGEPVTATLNSSHTGWQKIDVTSIVSMWLREPIREKLRLLVDCSCCANWRIHLFNKVSDKLVNRNRPFLVIYTDPNSVKRVRRRAIDCSVDSGGSPQTDNIDYWKLMICFVSGNQCCKQRFYVSFKALGWEDWVIAPKG